MGIMNYIVTQELNHEIEKLKVKDYTSYQKFYSETAEYLYWVIWNNVKNQDIANELINALYTDIYNTIGTELTDNGQFFSWAADKAQMLTNQYLIPHNIIRNHDADGDDHRAGAVAANAAMGAAVGGGYGYAVPGEIAGGISHAGIGTAAGGASHAGIGTAAGGISHAGIGTAAGGTSHAGIGKAAGGASHAGIGTAAGGTSHAGIGTAAGGARYAGRPNNAGIGGSHGTGKLPGSGGTPGPGKLPGRIPEGFGSGSASIIGKAKKALGMKLVFGTIGAIGVIGVTIGIIHIIKSGDKDKVVEATTEIATEKATEVASENTTEAATEATTEEVVDVGDMPERYAAYYVMITDDDGLMLVKENANDSTNNTNFPCSPTYENLKLVDFNGDGDKQLIVIEDDTVVNVYDYIDGNIETILNVDYKNSELNFTLSGVWSKVILRTADDGTSTLVIGDPDEGGSILEYTYSEGGFTSEQLLGEDEYNDVLNKICDDTHYTCEVLGTDGSLPAGADVNTLTDSRDNAQIKVNYDDVLGELVTGAKLDTSDVWKQVYAKKLQELKDGFYSQDRSGTSGETDRYSFALQDMNGDDVPELIGIFHGMDGGSNFIMTCSRYGVYDYLRLQRGFDISSDENYFNSQNGTVHTARLDYDPSTHDFMMTADNVYAIDKGCFIMVGDYNEYYPRMSDELIKEWDWNDYDGSLSKGYKSLSESEYNTKADSLVGTKTFDEVFTPTDSIDEITNMISNY